MADAETIAESKWSRLLMELLWPAAAGNIAWSMFDLGTDIIKKSNDGDSPTWRLAVVFLFAIYAVEYWSKGGTKPAWPVWGRYLHLLFLTFAAVMIPREVDLWGGYSMAAFFLLNVMLHTMTIGEAGRDKNRVTTMIFANGFGLVFAALAIYFESCRLSLWAIGIGVPVLMWLFVSRKK